MIYITTALYCEAKALIRYYNLKKDMINSVFQIFKSKNVTLIITGVNKINSAIGVTHLVSNKEINEEDIIVNIGISGTKEDDCKIGNVYLINKIVDNETKKCYYPDILFNHSFKESSIETFSKTVTHGEVMTEPLCDMESSGFYIAANKYFQSHQIFLFKIVSDRLEEVFDEKFVSDLVLRYMYKIDSYISKIVEELIRNKEEEIDLSKLDTISDNLNLTVSQRYILFNKYKKYLIRENKEPDINSFYDKKVDNKDDRDKIFKELISLL